MAFIGVLPENLSVGQQVGRNLGQGIGSGIGQAADILGQLSLEKLKAKQRQNLIKSLMGNPQVSDAASKLASGEMEEAPSSGEPTSDQIATLSLFEPEYAKILESQRKERSKQEFKEKEIALHETKELREEINQGFKTAKMNEQIYKRMEALNKEDLVAPMTAKLSERLGIPLSVLGNPSSEEFDKLSNTLSREVSSIYKGRILQSEFQNFLKQIPTLLNSKEGRSRILETLRMIDKPKELYHKAYREVVKENKGKIPLDLNERIIDKVEPELDKLAENFKNTSSGNGKLTLEVMQQFLRIAPGNTKEEKIANAKKMAAEQGYIQ